LYKDLDIVRVIKVARTSWLGHSVTMEENSASLKVTFSHYGGSRKNVRPKLRWIDSVLKCKVIESTGMMEESTSNEYLGYDHQGGQVP
jgi:hypothetical protein